MHFCKENSVKHLTITAIAFCIILGAVAAALAGENGLPSPEQFTKLHAMIKRQPGEARYLEIDWRPNVWEARQVAAREGKPLFIWAGSEGAPSAGC
jgi:hypothetical protein